MIKTSSIITIIISGLLFIQISCNLVQRSKSDEQIIRDFYTAQNVGSFDLVSKCVSDSIVTSEMQYVLTKSKKDLYSQFQWDSVFNAQYKLIDLKKDNGSYTAIISKMCKRIEYLQDTVIIIKESINLQDKQITKIEITDYLLLNTTKWQKRTEDLIAWINKNHPELSGFNNDLTLKGAQNYLKAVELYKTSNP